MNQTFSKNISEKEIELIYKYMQSHMKNNDNINVKYFFKTARYSITIYNNNKILVQGENYDWLLKILKVDNHLNVDENKGSLPTKKYMGSDESGTGDFFGGISVATAYAPLENYEQIQELGVKDSKLMNDEHIFSIIDDLKKLCKYEIISLSPKEYNKMYEKHSNIKIILACMHLEAIENLSSKIGIKDAIIDQFVAKKVFMKYIENEGLKTNLNLDFVTKGESKFLNIAIASIFARWAFIKSIYELQKNTNHKIKLGCDYRVEEIAKNILRDNKPEDFVKTHFKTLKKINVR